jgi:hypothetical protein
MGRILIACQGTSRQVYEYTYNDQKVVSKATFIAISKLLKDIEKVILFVTPQSRDVAEELIKEENLSVPVEYRDISSTDFEKVIENMFDCLDKNSNALIDLTQGYRHLPMLLLIATLIENIELEKKRNILFALEMERPANSKYGKSKFMNLTVYLDIAYFNQILYFFGKSVNMPLYLTKKIQDPELKKVGRELAKFSNFFFENNLPVLEREVSKLKTKLMDLVEDSKFHFSTIGIKKAIGFLEEIEKVKSSSHEAEKHLLLARIYNKRNYQLNAVTNLFEALLCIIEMLVKPSEFQKKKKKGSIYSIRNAYKRLLLDRKDKEPKLMEKYGKITVSRSEFDKKKLLEVEKRLKKILAEVDKIRNSMAHGFINKSKVRKADKLSQRIRDYIRETEELLNIVK